MSETDLWTATAIIGALGTIIFGGWLIIIAGVYIFTGSYPVDVGPRATIAIMGATLSAVGVAAGLQLRRGA